MDELLRKYAGEKDQAAFAQLVNLHIHWMYAAALRQTQDAHLADDVVQAVFLLLARKAATMAPQTRLTGWLFNAIRHIARDAMKMQRRRERHEWAVGTEERAKGEAAWWSDVSPILDAAVARLSRLDRELVLGRFYRDQSYEAVAAEHKLSAEAARKRISRALGELRGYLQSQAGELPGELDGVLQAKVTAGIAPAALVASAVAMGGGTGPAAISALATKGATALLWAKMKVAAVVIMGTIAVGGAGVGAEMMRRAVAAPTQVAAAGPVAPETIVPGVVSRVVGPPFVAKLSNGVAVELIGLAPNPSDGKAWWRPDGEALRQRPYPRAVGVTSRGEGYTLVEMAVRVTVPAGVDEGEVTLTPGLAQFWVAVYPVAGRPGLYSLAGGPPKADTTGVLRIRIATGAWLPMTQLVPPARQAVADTLAGHVELLDAHDDANGQAAITAILPLDRQDREVQVVAVDLTGKAHSPVGTDSQTSDRKTTAWMRFTPPLAKIKEFRARYRPYDGWLEYRNVSLVAGVKTDVQIVSGERASASAPVAAPTTGAAQTRRLVFAATLGQEAGADWSRLEPVPDTQGKAYMATAHVPLGGSFPVQDQGGKTLFTVTMVLGSDGRVVLEVNDAGRVQRIDLDRDQAVALRVAGGEYRFVYPSVTTADVTARATTTKAMIVVLQERP